MDIHIRRTRIITAALVFALAGAAQAAQMFTPPLQGAAGTALQCNILNASNRDRDLTIRFLDQDGNPTLPDFVVQNMPPGFVAGTAQGTVVGTRYCHFIVQGGKNEYRASGCIISGGKCISAVPAQ